MPEHLLVRQVLLNCVKPTRHTLFADVLNLSIENATKMSKDWKLLSSNRPSLRCQPLSGGVAIEEVSNLQYEGIRLPRCNHDCNLFITPISTAIVSVQ